MLSPNWRHILRENFGYDLYANQLWLPFVLASPVTEERAVFEHILAAQLVWAKRLEGVSLTAKPDVEISLEVLQSLHDQWVTAVDNFEYDHLISFQNTRGEPFSRTFGDIARHVANHGTYHRGHLRGLFGARGVDFPESDFAGYSLRRDHP